MMFDGGQIRRLAENMKSETSIPRAPRREGCGENYE
jgi:hypothetical protein